MRPLPAAPSQERRDGRRKRRGRVAAAAAMTVMAAAGSVAFGQPSSDTPPDPSVCTYAHLVVQQKVVLSTRSRTVPAKVNTDCFADWFPPDYRWEAFATDGTAQDTVIFSQFDLVPIGSIVDYVEVDDTNHLGVWTWRPLSANPPLTTASLNTTRMDVRLGAVAYASAVRHGSTVSVTARAYRYWTSTHTFGPWTRVRGTIEYALPGQPWRPLKYAYPSSTGRYTYAYTTTQQRRYRVVFPDQQYVWGAVSAATAAT